MNDVATFVQDSNYNITINNPHPCRLLVVYVVVSALGSLSVKRSGFVVNRFGVRFFYASGSVVDRYYSVGVFNSAGTPNIPTPGSAPNTHQWHSNVNGYKTVFYTGVAAGDSMTIRAYCQLVSSGPVPADTYGGATFYELNAVSLYQ